MSELVPSPFADLVSRTYFETERNLACFGLPRKKWYLPEPAGLDLSVSFHGQRAGNPSGPAAGPHTQMAQNLLLSYLAGGRILELKTVQVNDRLTIGRPCIDATNIGYNIEWSQELLVEQSLREYAAGAMLIEMVRRDPHFGAAILQGREGDVIYDISVGYDLAGIRGEKVQRFLDGMRDARPVIDALREQIPASFRFARDLDYPSRLSTSVTLSTFHGCPAGEIERICEHLIGERDLDVIVKMNPPMLGRERLEHLLHDQLGYTELTVNPAAYESGLRFEESVHLTNRLMSFARARGRSFGCKFSNTLEVLNHRTFFTPDNKVQYLSGQPLHVITMALTDEFRRAVGGGVPISFSAGIDAKNFAAAVSCGFVPVSVCTDLLRPGGYGRLPGYLRALGEAMRAAGAHSVDEFIRKVHGTDDPTGARNTVVAAEAARNDPRYRAAQNRKVPVRIDSHLTTFDCITCDKCIPVCPNAANFTYPTPKVTIDDVQDVIVAPDGTVRRVPGKKLAIEREMQIANFADFCNDCGNCDTFCPEYGGPYIKKPAFFGSEGSWRSAAPRDGFVITRPTSETIALRGRIQGIEYILEHDAAGGRYRYLDGVCELSIESGAHTVLDSRALRPLAAEHRVDLWIYHAMRHLLAGVLEARQVHSVNAPLSYATR